MRVLAKQTDLDTESPEEEGSNLQYYNEINHGCFAICLKTKRRRKISFTIYFAFIIVILIGLLIQRLIYNHDLKIVNDVILWQDARYEESYHLQYNYNFVDDLKSLCENTLWRPTVFLNCTNIADTEGYQKANVILHRVGEVRNSLISCLRLAIDGGMNLILPQFTTSNDTDLSGIDHGERFDSLFDEIIFRSVLALECPQLKIYDATYDVENKIKSDSNASAKNIFGTYFNHVNELLEKTTGYSITVPTAILENHTYLGWYFSQDSRTIRNTMYRAVPFAVSLTLIAEKILFYIPKTFIGIQLLREAELSSISYETQINLMTEYLNTNLSHINTIYISTDDEGIELRLRKDLASKKIDVVSKNTILANTNDKELLDGLSLYQLGAVDFMVIKDAKFFFGDSSSSFSYSIALERSKGDISQENSRLFGSVSNDYLECM